ncbi:MAG: 3'(2'),5'-bisphosphate nucleotidase [Pirellulales bacterium]
MLRSLEAQFAVETVRRAAQLVLQVQAELVPEAIRKEDRSPVTVADFASQAMVSARLAAAYPDDPLVAEEDAGALRSADADATLGQIVTFVGREMPGATGDDVCCWIDHGRCEPAGRFWCLDPIDGTKGFLRGDQFAVALALIVDGRVELGVLGCPNLCGPREDDGDAGRGGRGNEPGEDEWDHRGVLVVAARGEGAWSAPLHDGDGPLRSLRVSAAQDPAGARLLRSFESGHTNVDQVDRLADRLGTNVEPVRMDSQAKYAVLAAGEGDVLVRLLSPARPDYRERIWDQAAGSIIVEEAGGRVSDLDGRALDFTAGRTLARNRGIVATNGHLHGALLDAVRAIGA